MTDLDLFYSSSKFYFSDDHLKLHYRDLGTSYGEYVIICLPGLTRNSRDFELLATHLADSNRVICPDLRGRGLSDHDPQWKNYHPSTYANDIWKLLDELEINKIVIIGTSLGGLIAMFMAFQNSTRIVGVLLNDIGPDINPIGLQRIKQYTGKLSAVENWQQACEQTKKVYASSLINIEESQWPILSKRAYRENNKLQPVLDMDSNIGKAINEVGPQIGDPWQLFDALISIPSTVLRGEFSDILSERTVAKMKTKNPHLKSVNIPNRGHVPLLDEPESLKAIQQLLESIKL